MRKQVVKPVSREEFEEFKKYVMIEFDKCYETTMRNLDFEIDRISKKNKKPMFDLREIGYRLAWFIDVHGTNLLIATTLLLAGFAFGYFL